MRRLSEIIRAHAGNVALAANRCDRYIAAIEAVPEEEPGREETLKDEIMKKQVLVEASEFMFNLAAHIDTQESRTSETMQ